MYFQQGGNITILKMVREKKGEEKVKGGCGAAPVRVER